MTQLWFFVRGGAARGRPLPPRHLAMSLVQLYALGLLNLIRTYVTPHLSGLTR